MDTTLKHTPRYDYQRDDARGVTVTVSTGDGHTSGPIPAPEFDARMDTLVDDLAAGLTGLTSGTGGVTPYPAQAKDDQRYPVPLVTDDFQPAPDLKTLAQEVIRHYDLPAGLAGQITYLWRQKGGTSKGNVTLGQTQRPSGLLAYFAHTDFVLWLAADHLGGLEATYRQVRACLFHELAHIQPDDRDGHEGEYRLCGHDFEGFGDEIRAFGLWQEPLQVAARAIQAATGTQLTLDLDGDKTA